MTRRDFIAAVKAGEKVRTTLDQPFARWGYGDPAFTAAGEPMVYWIGAPAETVDLATIEIDPRHAPMEDDPIHQTYTLAMPALELLDLEEEEALRPWRDERYRTWDEAVAAEREALAAWERVTGEVDSQAVGIRDWDEYTGGAA